tara:strand:+ start:77 stop:1141 length:1065 start_codon:yes stop_codon:yes gene_type:complete
MNPSRIEPLYGPFAWNASSLDQNGGWSVELDIDEIACLDDALNTVVSRQIAWSSLTKTQFPLPVLSQKLEAISTELEDGCGMVSIRGISPTRYTPDELHTLWFGLNLHLGTPVYQNPQGQLLRDICNEGDGVGKTYGQMDTGEGVFLSSRARTASTAQLRFHTDRADIVGLLCVSRAKSGGETRIASSVTVHNEMIRRRPALAALLYAPIYRSRLGEEKRGDQMFYPLPVFGCREGKFTSHYSRTYVEAAQLLPDVPKMTDDQWAALDLLADLADEYCVESVFEPGDIQLLNNHVIYHARRPFIDDAASGYKRNLMRIWLCPPGNRALPEDHAPLWRIVEADSLRGGIALEPAH